MSELGWVTGCHSAAWTGILRVAVTTALKATLTGMLRSPATGAPGPTSGAPSSSVPGKVLGLPRTAELTSAPLTTGVGRGFGKSVTYPIGTVFSCAYRPLGIRCQLRQGWSLHPDRTQGRRCSPNLLYATMGRCR